MCCNRTAGKCCCHRRAAISTAMKANVAAKCCIQRPWKSHTHSSQASWQRELLTQLPHKCAGCRVRYPAVHSRWYNKSYGIRSSRSALSQLTPVNLSQDQTDVVVRRGCACQQRRAVHVKCLLSRVLTFVRVFVYNCLATANTQHQGHRLFIQGCPQIHICRLVDIDLKD